MLTNTIRNTARIARTLTFTAVGGIAFYYVFSYVFYPALILSGAVTFVSVLSAVIYKDTLAMLLVNILMHVHRILWEENYDPDEADFNLDTRARQAKFVLAAPLFSLTLAVVSNAIFAFTIAAKLAFATIATLDFIATPITNFLGPDPDVICDPTENAPAICEPSPVLTEHSLTTNLANPNTMHGSLFALNLFRETFSAISSSVAQPAPTYQAIDVRTTRNALHLD